MAGRSRKVTKIPGWARDWSEVIFSTEPKGYSPPTWCGVFLDTLRKIGVVSYAAREAGIARQHAYKYAKEHEWFNAAWEESIEAGIERMEAEARRRAIAGVEEPVFQGGEQVGTKLRYSDTLLIFLLKAARPGVYRERIDVNHGFTGEVPPLLISAEPEEEYLARRGIEARSASLPAEAGARNEGD